MAKHPSPTCQPDCPGCEREAEERMDPNTYDADYMADVEAARYENWIMG